jgi:hypothetical protein
MLDWLLAPINTSALHQVQPWAAWHGRCMVLAWGALLPLGALAARYYKVLPTQAWPQTLDNPAWWHAHRASQYCGVLLMCLGLALAWQQGQGATGLAQWHSLLGWLLFVMTAAQLLGAWLRGSKGGPLEPEVRGDHYDMTTRRVVFEKLHKSLGWLALALGLTSILLGLLLANAPRWMALALAVWWLVLSCAAWRLQLRGRCIDTYQAIWGPDAVHPGNAKTPVGWGVRRLDAPVLGHVNSRR